MKQFVLCAVAGMLSASIATAVSAAPASTPPQQPQGIQNAKKVMKARFDREQKIREVKNKGQAQRQHAERQQTQRQK